MKNLLIITLIFLLSSCLARVEKRGYSFELSDYVAKDGISSKFEILQNMGSPTIVSSIDNRIFWVYFEEKIKRFLFFKPDILEREILVLSFDKDNIVKKLDRYNLASEKNIKFSTYKTPFKEIKKGFFADLFGNIGKISAQ